MQPKPDICRRWLRALSALTARTGPPPTQPGRPGGAFFTPSIGPTIDALTELAPDLLVPGHCTGWRAQHALAAALPNSWVQSSSGTRYQLTASLPG